VLKRNFIELVRRLLVVAVSAMAAAWIGPALAQGSAAPRVHFNQIWIEEAAPAHAMNISDPMAVFAFVFANLPDRVHVYPTENYYYFSFVANGTPYQGNIRLDPLYRDEGKLLFAYFDVRSLWRGASETEHLLFLDQSQGVKLERLGPLAYQVTYGGRAVVFTLNDLSAVKPPPGFLLANEYYLGPVFDESAVRFFLIYDRKAKVFHYILDETAPLADMLSPAERTDRILIGRRTGFAFYRDHRLERKILIGVHSSNVVVNNYFDGPADQLPENFIAGEDLREAITDADPSVKGKIDRLGHYIGTKVRYVVDPYLYYSKESELLGVHSCATAKAKRAVEYPRCFAARGH
jgi:hypothetical protein